MSLEQLASQKRSQPEQSVILPVPYLYLTKVNSLDCSRKFKNTSFYTSVKDIDKEIWECLNCDGNMYFRPDYLESIEAHHPHVFFLYVVLRNHQKQPIAIANCQLLDFYIDSLNSKQSGFLNSILFFARKLKILPTEKPLKILNCGNLFVSGDHGIYIKEGHDKKLLLRAISKAILNYTKENHLHLIDIFIIRDFVKESLHISNELISMGYYALNVEPNMKLNLNASWNSFHDYLSTLKTKFRVKANKAFKLGNNLKVEDITKETVENYMPSMRELYKKVTSKAFFNLGEFNVESYRNFMDKFEKEYILRSYSLNGKMVGFLSGMINQKSLDAHFVGIDYHLNKTYGIYQRMLYDYIDIAIQHKLETINFGRTASEIKSSIGAVPEHLTIYVRHKKTITNKFLKLFLLRIQPTSFKQKFPFK